MGKIRIIHYATRIITNLACGLEMFKKTKCLVCGMTKCGPGFDSSFSKRDVTCGRCQQTLVYKYEP